MTRNNRTTLIALLGAGTMLAASPALAQQQPPLPGFKPDRTAEDYSSLRDRSDALPLDARIKFVPLDPDRQSYLSLGGEIRERAESLDRPAFGIGGHDPETYLLQRVLVHADLHLGSAVRVFAQLGAEEAFGKQTLALPDEDHLDLRQLFVEVKPLAALKLRLGRQEMAFNPAQRFVSFRDGTNVHQNFDGARATLGLGRIRLDGFLVRPVTLRRGVFDDVSNRQQWFGGVYGAYALGPQPGASADAYWFYLDRDVASFGGVTGAEHRHSLGLRTGGAAKGWDWDVEGLIQRGNFAGQSIRAWGLSADLGYTLATTMKPRLGVRFDSGSGDHHAGDGKLGTFNPLFPKGPYFNEANVTSFANLVAIRPSLRVQPVRTLTLEGAVQWKWKEARADSVYLGPAAALAGTRGGPDAIGEVYSADANLALGRHWSLRAYYLHHSAGDAIRAAHGRAIDFGMASAQFRF